MRWVAALMLLAACGGPLKEGAEAFERGELDAAIAPWEAVAREGNASGRVHFDLGNAWYRKGDLSRAIAHYRAAQALRPRDGNVHHNLAVARSELRGVPEAAGPATPWSRFVTPGELSALGLLLLATGSTLAWRWRRGGSRELGLAAAACWVLGVAVAVTAALGGLAMREQPVLVAITEASARDLPVLDGEVAFALPPGAEVRVVDDRGDFVLVEDGRARRGWVARAALYPDW